MIPLSTSRLIDVLLSSWWFVVILVIILLAVLWMQHYRASRRQRSDMRKRPGINPVIILGMVTVFALVLLALPWYLGNMEDRQPQVAPHEVEEIAPENREEIVLKVEGMTCTGCESLIHQRVGEMDGVHFVKADHQLHETLIVFDKTRTGREQIVVVIEDAGYRVAGE